MGRGVNSGELQRLRGVATAAGGDVGWHRGPEGIYIFRDDRCGMVAEAGEEAALDHPAGAVGEARGLAAGMQEKYADHMATFDPPTVLGLLRELEEAQKLLQGLHRGLGSSGSALWAVCQTGAPEGRHEKTGE